MESMFKEVKSQFKFPKEDPTVNSNVFRAMKGTMAAVLLSCILCTLKNFIGDNINCITGFEKNEHKAVETYCFISSTYSMVNLSDASPHYGIGPLGPKTTEEDVPVHAYYQWVSFVLAAQCGAYYFPRWLWKKFIDRKAFKTVLGDLDRVHLTESTEQVPKHVNVSAEYMAQSLNTHTFYAVKFLCVEILAFAIALGNLFVTDKFLGGAFMSYGDSAFSYLVSDITNQDNPLNRVFPKVTKCNWYKYGPTGSIQTFDALCILPLNIVNEKTFVLLWFVYIICITVVSLSLLLHIVYLLVPGMRHKVMLSNMKSETKKDYKNLIKKIDYGDWFMMSHLKKNMVGCYFEMWLQAVNVHVNK